MNLLLNNYSAALNNTGRWFCNYGIDIFIQSGILIILLLIIDFLLRKRLRATFRYWIWMLVLLKLMLPPAFSLPTGIGRWFGDYIPAQTSISQQVSNTARLKPAGASAPQDPSFSGEIPQVHLSQVNPEPAAPALPVISDSQTFTWQAVVFVIWLTGAAVLSVLLVHRLLFVRRLIAQSEPAKSRYADILAQCRQKLGIKRKTELRLSGKLQSPAVCGFFTPVILIPTGLLEKLSPDKLRAVLIHELAHIKRGDLWVNCVQTSLQIIYFYNPLIWLANAIIRRIREQAVDEMVLVALGAEAGSYSNTLIDVAEMAFSKPALSLRLVGVVESKKALTGRIKHILHRPIPKSAKLGICGLLTIIITAAILLPMAKGQKVSVPQNRAYENAKGSKNYKIKVGPTSFEAHTVVRWFRDGNCVIMNPANDALVNVPYKIPDFSVQTRWMDIAQVYFNPEQTKYDVIELRVFDHATRELLDNEDYPGIGYRIDDSVVMVYSTGKILPDTLDIWMRVLHRTAKHIYILTSHKQASVDIDGNPLRIIDIAKGRYNWANGKRTKHHDQWDEFVTSVAMKFDKHGNKEYQVCAVGIDGIRIVPDYPHFLRPSNGWQLIEFGISMDRIRHFEIAPFKGRDRFFFDNVKLPPRSGGLDPVPTMRFTINGQGGKHHKQVDSFFDVDLNVLPNTEITSLESSDLRSGAAYTFKDSANSLTAIVCRVSGFCMTNKTFIAYDKDGNRLDNFQGRGGGYALGVNSACHYSETKSPLKKIHTIDVYFEEIIDPERLPSNIYPDQATQNSNFTATLPNGVTIELLGVCDIPAEGKQWWAADGGTVENVFWDGTAIKENANKARQVVFRILSNDNDPDAQPTVSFNPKRQNLPEGSSWSGGFCVSRDNQTIKNLKGLSFSLHDDQEKIDIVAIIGYGKWQTQAVKKADSFGDLVSGITNIGTLILNDPTETEGKTFITATLLNRIESWRIIAIDKQGTTLLADTMTSVRNDGKSVVEHQLCKAEFLQPLSEIAEFQFQSRKVQTVTFKNVSLEPGIKTDVQVEAGKPNVLRVPSEKYPTIQSAVNAAKEGDKIVADPNTMKENTTEQNMSDVQTDQIKEQKTILLPDFDITNLMLDLVSGELVKVPKADTPEEITLAIEKLDKGDLIFDASSLILVRGATSRSIPENPAEPFQRYEIGNRLPEIFNLRTKEGIEWTIEIHSVDKNGCLLIYYPVHPNNYVSATPLTALQHRFVKQLLEQVKKVEDKYPKQATHWPAGPGLYHVDAQGNVTIWRYQRLWHRSKDCDADEVGWGSSQLVNAMGMYYLPDGTTLQSRWRERGGGMKDIRVKLGRTVGENERVGLIHRHELPSKNDLYSRDDRERKIMLHSWNSLPLAIIVRVDRPMRLSGWWIGDIETDVQHFDDYDKLLVTGPPIDNPAPMLVTIQLQ